jgi:hypothetical protein
MFQYYLSKPLTSLSCSLNAVFPGLKMWDTFACLLQKKLTHFIISIAVLENVPPGAGLQKKSTFSTPNVGLSGTGNRTRATCVASSGTSRSAIRQFLSILRFRHFWGFSHTVNFQQNLLHNSFTSLHLSLSLYLVFISLLRN